MSRRSTRISTTTRPANEPDAALPTGTVTFLFTDIDGSTRLLSTLGEAYTELLEQHSEILRAAISSHDGLEVSTEGDAFFAVFSSATDAVAAVASAQHALADASWPDGATVRVRMGLHTGEGRLGGDDYIGLDVHRAARIAAAGHGGQVLLSHTTHALVAEVLPDGAGLVDLGVHRLKDIAVPMRITQLVLEGLPTEFPALKTLDARPGNLPEQRTSFVGRERAMAKLSELVDEHRLVTLTGPGGTGKTRLALQHAAKVTDGYRDGAFFVDLAPIRDPAMVPMAVAQALRVGVDPGGDALTAVRAYVRDRELLLVLDNFEQVVEGAGLVDDLLAAAPEMRVVVTSRMPLGLYGEQEYEVPPLQPDASDGIDLFVDRARALQPGFELTGDHAAAVAAIVARLDGLPLAIELAAGHLRVLTLEAILSRLDQHLPLPAGTGQGRPERQRTMRNAIEWSYDLLDEPDQRLFARLSAFPGGWSLEAAEAVGDPGDLGTSVLDGIGSLVGKSLVRQAEGADGEPRFDMLETIMEYAGERLRDGFDADATNQRMAEYFVAFAEEAAPHLTAEDQASWLDRCDRERSNLRRALEWAAEARQADVGLRTATALWRFWQQRGPMAEGRRAIDRLLDLPSSPGVRARALGAACGLAWWDGDFEAMQRHAQSALPLIEQGGDREGLVEALYNVGFALLWSAVLGGGKDADRGEELFRQSQALAEELGDRRGVGRALRGLGLITGVARGNPRAAIPIFQQSVAVLEGVGDRWEVIESVIAVGNGFRFSGDKDEARSFYLRGIDLAAEAGNRQTMYGLLSLLAALEGERGRHERVATLWGAAAAAREASGAIKPPAMARLVGDPVSAARQAIGDEAVDRALASGRSMDLDATLAYAHG